MKTRYKASGQFTTINPYVVQLLLSQDYIKAKKGEEVWNSMYLEACAEIKKQLGVDSTKLCLIFTISDEVGIVNYKDVCAVVFDYKPNSGESLAVFQEDGERYLLVDNDFSNVDGDIFE